MPKAFLATEIILKWRLQAQIFEKTVQDNSFAEHHSSRANNKSIKGPLFKPQLASIPAAFNLKGAVQGGDKDIRNITDMLFLTACNWGEFINNNSLSLKYVRFVLQAMEVRKSMYEKQILRDSMLREIFDHILEVVPELGSKVGHLIRLPTKPAGDKGKGKEQTTYIPMVHTSIAHVEVEKIDDEFQDGILKLQELVKKHGSLSEGDVMSNSVVEGYRTLSKVGFSQRSATYGILIELL
jgi:hypothetical protein